MPNTIYAAWNKFDISYTGNIDEDIKNKYNSLIHLTRDFLGYIKSIPRLSYNVANKPIIRTIDVSDEEYKLAQLNKKRYIIKEEINKLNKSAIPDNARIKDLSMQLKHLDADYKKITRTIEKVKADNNAEQTLAKRIDDAFNELQTYTSTIETEQKKIKSEYWTFFGTLMILIMISLISYYNFIYGILNKEIVIERWLDYLPYGIIVPIFIALIWLCTYLKNRANKISIELSMQLFSIHYLEGLLQMTNKLSHNQTEAMDNINKVVTTMLQDYQHQIHHNQIHIKDLSKYESNEFDFNPYWNFLKEIKELINTIKK